MELRDGRTLTITETTVVRMCTECWQVCRHSVLTPSIPDFPANRTCSHCGHVSAA